MTMLSPQSPASLLLTLLCLLPATLAKTDYAGCVSSDTVAYGAASLVWYLPDTGEVCSPVDCGGGRAPPKTTKPGCPGYEGTETVTPSFLPGFAAAATTATTTAPGGRVTEDSAIIPITTEPLTPESSSASASGADSTAGSDSTSESSLSLSQPTTITGSLVSTKTETDELTPPTVTTSAIAGTTAASTSSSTAGAAIASAGSREMLAMAAGLVVGLAAA